MKSQIVTQAAKQSRRSVGAASIDRSNVRIPKVARKSLQEDVYQALRQALMTGEFTPGQSLKLRNLAQVVGTSMMPVREALLRLVAEGALEMTQTRVVTLPMMTRDRLRQIYRVRVALEAMLAGDATKRISDADIKTLEKLIERMELARKASNTAKFLEANLQFHFTLYRAANEHVMFRMVESLWLQSGPFIHYGLAENQMELVNKHHRAVVQAIKKGDARAASKAISTDLGETQAVIMKWLPEDGARDAQLDDDEAV